MGLFPHSDSACREASLFRNFPADVMDARCQGHMMERRIEMITDFLRASGLKPGARVLEIGAGTGRTMAQVAQNFPGVSFIGIEPVAEYVAYAQKTYAAMQPGLDYRQGDLRGIALSPGSVDCAYSVNLWHHIPIADLTKAAANLHAVLKIDSRIFVLEPNAFHPYIYCYQACTKGERPFYQGREGRALMNFFHLLERKYCYVFPEWLRHPPVWAKSLERLLERCPFFAGSQCCVFIKK